MGDTQEAEKAAREEALDKVRVIYSPDDMPPAHMWDGRRLAIGPVDTPAEYGVALDLNTKLSKYKALAQSLEKQCKDHHFGVFAREVFRQAWELEQHDAYVKQELDKIRVRADARERFDAEQHAKAWREPVDHGDLAAELALPEEPEAWRLRGLLGLGHNAILVAGRKAGKTTMVNNLVRSYVDGEPFLGRFDVTPTDAAVAVFNYELDERQYRRWLRDAGIQNTDRVHVLHLRGRSLPLRHPRVRDWVTAWLRARDVGLWVLDPYSRAYVGSVDNGNDEAQVGTFLDTLDVIKAEAGVGELVMPAHTPKARVEIGEETAIGSQRLEGWPDALWYLTRDLVTGLRFLRAEGRDVDVDEQQLTFDPPTRTLTLGGASRATVRQEADKAAVLAYVTEHPRCTGRDITGALGWGADRLNRAIAQCQGRIVAESGKNRARHYSVVDLSSALDIPEHSGTPEQSGALRSIGSTTASTSTTGAEDPPLCLDCGEPRPLNLNSMLCASCTDRQEQTA